MDALWATSAFGVERLPSDPWPTRQVPKSLSHDGRPLFVTDIHRTTLGVSECLDTGSGVLVPLAQLQKALGILVVGSTVAQIRDTGPGFHRR